MRGIRSSAPASPAARRSSRRGLAAPRPQHHVGRRGRELGAGGRQVSGGSAGRAGRAPSGLPAGSQSPRPGGGSRAHLSRREGSPLPAPAQPLLPRSGRKQPQERGTPHRSEVFLSRFSLILSSDPKNTRTNYSPVLVVLTHGSGAAPGLWRCIAERYQSGSWHDDIFRKIKAFIPRRLCLTSHTSGMDSHKAHSTEELGVCRSHDGRGA